MRVRALLISLLCLGTAVLRASDPGAAAPAVSPDAALTRLMEGNARFRQNALVHPNQDSKRRADTAAHGQAPFAIVLSCSDSRVPPEVVFDQGVGDLFVIRVAGNVAGGDEAASIEYGAAHLNVPLCVVMGHSGCGAVSAAVEGAHATGSLAQLLQEIQPAVARARQASPGMTGLPLLAKAIEANVWLSIESLLNGNDTLRKLVAAGRLRIIGAIYDLPTGQVRFLGEHPEIKRLLGVSPAADASERRFTLDLCDDGAALLRTDYAGKGEIEESGRWVRCGNNVSIRFGASPPIVWEWHGAQLQPRAWDHGEWGDAGPPVFFPGS